MSYTQTHKTRSMSVTKRRGGDDGPLVPSTIEIEAEFYADRLDGGHVVPPDTLGALDEAFLELFDGRILISQTDPYADDLMKLKRIKAADPTLLAAGTTNHQIAEFAANLVDDWVHEADWNKEKDGNRVSVLSACVIENGRISARFEFD